MKITSPKEPSLSEVVSDAEIAPSKLAYFRARLRNALYDVVVSEFVRQRKECDLKKSDLARRIHRRPEQITRWLSTPQNWTIDTVSDLLLAMHLDLAFSISRFGEENPAKTVKDSKPGTANVVSLFSTPGQRHRAHSQSYGFATDADFAGTKEKAAYGG